MISVKLTERELLAHNACDYGTDSGMAFFRRLVRLQCGSDAGALVIREWTQLHSVWLSLTPWAGWLIKRALVPRAALSRADLRGADLYGADLRRANLGSWERGPDGYARMRVA